MTTPQSAWKNLRNAAVAARDPIADLFAIEPERMEKLVVEAAGLRIDLSKQPWSLGDFDTALTLAKACDVEQARNRLWAGEPVNSSENRAALHMALRAPDGADFQA